MGELAMESYEIITNRYNSINKERTSLSIYFIKNNSAMPEEQKNLIREILKKLHEEQEILARYISYFEGNILPQDKRFIKQLPKDRRRFFRVNLIVPLCMEVTIVQVGNFKVDIGKTKVCVNDIGPGGIAFTSNLHFPVDKDVLLKFETKILGETIQFPGSVVREISSEHEFFKYGVRFEIDEILRSHYVQLFNRLLVNLKDRDTAPNCSFCRTSMIRCLREKRKEEQKQIVNRES